MKQIFCKTIACCAALLSFAACEKTDDLSDAGQGSGAIILDLSSGDMTRADAGTFDFEKRVDHLDVLIFDETGNTKMWYERIQTGSTTGGGEVALTADRSKFAPNQKYWVYVIANASDEEKDTSTEKMCFEKITKRGDLLAMPMRLDPYIHLTGMPKNNSENIALPQNFLMDGAAYAGATEPTTSEGDPMATAVTLNDGNAQNDTQLKVTLRRAAVKLVLKLIPAADGTIKFLDPGTGSGASEGDFYVTGGYYLRNMPFTTCLTAEQTYAADEVQVRTPRQTRNHYFDLHSSGTEMTEQGEKRIIDYITVTAYTYAHSWSNESSLEREPRWIVDIPLEYNNGAKDKDIITYQTCYYQIPICDGVAIKRNTCYTVNATISTPGGTNPEVPVNLTALKYEVVPWTESIIPIGGESDHPKFLTVNRTEMEMRNIATDNTTLEFSSSSEATATVTAAYYIDKFGQTKQVSNNIRNQIKLTPDSGVSGNIKIESPIPTNNTIRYIEVEITNKDGVEPRKVLIKQYPLTYITNVEGYYSYRDDFTSTASDGTTGVTTWELLAGKKINKGQEYNSPQVPYNRDNAWICGCSWGKWIWGNNGWQWEQEFRYLKTEIDEVVGFFTSKAVTTYYPETGLSDLVNAYWTETREGGKNNRRYTYDTDSNDNSGVEDLHNHRMYYVRITATSSDYTLGCPRITNGQTDGGQDNAKLVSPSFMLASQLGAVRAADNVDIAADHCKHYVEVALVRNSDGTFSSGTVYDDWRLPTKAEVEIIYKYQNDSEAMDLVLGGNQYWSASGLVPKPGETTHNDMAIRCIRDAYEAPAADKSAEQAGENQ